MRVLVVSGLPMGDFGSFKAPQMDHGSFGAALGEFEWFWGSQGRDLGGFGAPP